MSFKRVGDDPTALRVQKKQRVSELLLEDIPEDEAKLLKNGRFACLVCKHCPVFDTVAVLSIHRQGKKHLANAKIRLEKLREDAELRQKREHMKYMESLEEDSNKEETPLLKITQQQTERALRGSRDVIKQCLEIERKPNNLPFFQSRKPLHFDLNDTTTGGRKNVGSSPSVLNQEQRKSKLLSQVKGPLNSFAKGTDIVVVKKKESQGSSSDLANSTQAASKSNSIASIPNQFVQASVRLSSGSDSQKKELSPTEKARREHFSRLRQAGWIMGLDGKWYKDENAEFDSDEDEPPTLL